MFNNNGNTLSEAKECWDDGQALKAGELIFAVIPDDLKPVWASTILRLSYNRVGTYFSAVAELLDISANPSDWEKAHGLFSKIRDSVLNLEDQGSKTASQELHLCMLYVAENVAKVIYNSSSSQEHFDEDAGAWVAKCMWDFTDELGDEQFAEAAQLALFANTDSW